MNVLLYGAGKMGKRLLNGIPKSGVKIVGIIDADQNKYGKSICGYTIDNPENIKKYSFDFFCICIADDAIIEVTRNLFISKGYTPEMEIVYQKLIYEIINTIQICGKKDYHGTKMNVVFDCSNGLVLGGIEAWTINVVSALSVHSEFIPYILTKECKENIFCLPQNTILYEDSKIMWNKIYNIATKIEEVLPNIVVLSHINEVYLAACILKRKYGEGIRIISAVHGGRNDIYRENFLANEYIDYYIGVSKDIEANLVKYGINKEKVSSMTCPFYCEEHLNRKYTINMEEPIKIGYAGRLDGFEKSQKRMDVILKLFMELKYMGVDYQFNIAGDGPAKERMIDFVNKNYLDNKIKFWGMLARGEIPDFWKQQDICVNMADYEGRSISIIEAMGNGAVPVVTDVSGVRDDIIDGKNGFIVPLEDYKLAAKYIKYLSENRYDMSLMGGKAHDVVYPKSIMSEHVKSLCIIFSHISKYKKRSELLWR